MQMNKSESIKDINYSVNIRIPENQVDKNQKINLNFTLEEFRYFVMEINKMEREGKVIDIQKAIDNAHYLSMLGESFRQIEEGKVRVLQGTL